MSKEYNFIREVRQQPDAVRRSLAFVDQPLKALAQKYVGKIDRIILVGCGDSYMLGVPAVVYAFECWSNIPCEAIEAAELSLFRYSSVNERTLVILISSSGRSIRVIDAGSISSQKGAKLLALVNQVPSPLAEAAHEVIQTQAGPTNAYPSKTTTAAMGVLYALALHMAAFTHSQPDEMLSSLHLELHERIPAAMDEVLKLEDEMKALAGRYAAAPIYSFIGSGANLARVVSGGKDGRNQPKPFQSDQPRRIQPPAWLYHPGE
jgi:glucosamine--fructose-6-phosphate aminotransferase (isomerizing)